MFNSYYGLKIKGKDVKRFFRYLYRIGVSFEKVSFNDDCLYIKVDPTNYKKIKEIKTSYEIKVVRFYGFYRLKHLIIDNIYFIIFFSVGLFLLYFLSNIIFKIEIIHSDPSIRAIVSQDLNKYNIKKYSFIKSYEEISKIKEKMLEEHKDSLEWIEFERVGTKYNIRLEKRIINNLKQEDKVKHIVAKKSGIIKKIFAENGEVIKKVNDYVKEGDIIISGEIFRNGEVVGTVSAEGDVFAEVWYKVKIEMPIHYLERKYTGKKKKILNFKFFDNSFNLFDFDPYSSKETKETVIFSDFFGLIKISFNEESEMIIKDEINTIADEEFFVSIAQSKIKENLKEGEYIISQKKLKTTLNNSTINTEVFFKVYENISVPKYFSLEEDSG